MPDGIKAAFSRYGITERDWRLFLDNLEETIDGQDARKRWRQAVKKIRKEHHREFRWGRGEVAVG